MEKQLYVISMSQGSYDSYSQMSVAVTDNLDKGQAYVDKMNLLYAGMKQKKIAFSNKEAMQWQSLNPRPSHKLIREKPQALNQWSQSYLSFCEAWYQNHMTPEELALVNHDDENHWFIEEVAWLDSI